MRVNGGRTYAVASLLALGTAALVISSCGDSGGDGGAWTLTDFGGTWIMAATGMRATWISNDGVGGIIDMGAFNLASPPGSYTVNAAGVVVMTVTGEGTFTGLFVSPTHVLLTSMPGDVYKVTDMTACQGTWTGSFVDSTGPVYSATITVLSAGDISGVSTVGSFPNVNGKMFSVNGIVAGFITTDDLAYYNQIGFSGTLSGNTMTGIYGADDPTPGDTGTVTLTLAP